MAPIAPRQWLVAGLLAFALHAGIAALLLHDSRESETGGSPGGAAYALSIAGGGPAGDADDSRAPAVAEAPPPPPPASPLRPGETVQAEAPPEIPVPTSDAERPASSPERAPRARVPDADVLPETVIAIFEVPGVPPDRPLPAATPEPAADAPLPLEVAIRSPEARPPETPPRPAPATPPQPVAPVAEPPVVKPPVVEPPVAEPPRSVPPPPAARPPRPDRRAAEPPVARSPTTPEPVPTPPVVSPVTARADTGAQPVKDTEAVRAPAAAGARVAATAPGPGPAPAASAASAAAAPGGAAALLAQGPVGRLEPDYVRRLRFWLDRNKSYPREARRKRMQGVVHLGFRVFRDGRVAAVSVREGSGFALLDAEAREMLRRAEPLPAFPDDMAGGYLDITVPVSFSLRGNR